MSRSKPVARYVGKLASGKRVYVNAYNGDPLAFAVFVTRINPTRGRVELVGRVVNKTHEEELRFNPETNCYERKPDKTPHIMTPRELGEEKVGWWNRHGHNLERAELVELELVKPRGTK